MKMTLIQLIESFVHDGELTDLEIYDLADWLNKNESEMVKWPGKLLALPLKKAWEDKIISEKERHELFCLLNNILIEHNKSFIVQNNTLLKRSKEKIDSVSGKAELPSIRMHFEVDSASMPGEKFKVELETPSCSCPDWINVRGMLRENSIPRACKHILACFRELEPDPSWPLWFSVYLRLGYKSLPTQKWAVAKFGDTEFLYSSANPEWGNVFCRSKNEELKYGYSINEDRWSYGKKPPFSENLSKLIIGLSNSNE